MRREELFSRSGFYGFLLQTNVLLHREATQAAIAALAPVLDVWDRKLSLPVLDLACGGWPVTVAEALDAFPDARFTYTGVDINPDQVALAAHEFPFPENITAVRVLEGNAWQPEDLGLAGPYAFIFSGMNLHHGTPEEIWYLGRQLKDLLAPGGVFFSHDVYRPDREPYRRRPDQVDGAPAWLVDPGRLDSVSLPDTRKRTEAEPGWRLDYVERMRRALLQRGASAEGAESTARHMASRDYPLSTRELTELMTALGLECSVLRYDDSAGPLGPFVACCTLTRSTPGLASPDPRR